MKAAQINAYGDASVIEITASAPKPKAGKGEVVVAVRAAALNPFDRKIREGLVQHVAELPFPAILGGDFAGVIDEVGEGVAGFKPGDEVYGQAGPLSGHGSFADYTPVKAGAIAAKPRKLDFIQAAAVPLAAVSAYEALVEHIELQKGQTILIHGGAGGIGSFAIQLAKHLGATVITTADSSSQEYVKSLGADQVINYQTQDFAAQVHNADAVFDTVGGETYIRSLQTLKPGGCIVTMVGPQDEARAKEKGVRTIYQSTQVNTNRLAAVASLCDEGVLTVHVDKTFPLEETAAAQEYLHSGKHRGKVVITLE
jgi:NADPH:quinone reductase-like Zn-dependent oxidoreductase